MEAITGSILLLCLISLTHANTSPEIITPMYSVCEDIPIDGEAFTIRASDPDGDPLIYSLLGPNPPYFTVERDTGRVIVKVKLDRETEDIIKLRVNVSDGPNFVDAKLTIILTDTNDNTPIFGEPSYDYEVRENTIVGTALFRVAATDADIGNAGSVRYSIEEVTPNDGFNPFSISPLTGEVKLNGRLNYTSLSTFYRLKINAADGGGRCHFDEVKVFSKSVFSFITVVDVPDLDPQFIGIPYVGRVEENSRLDQFVFRVTALDQDTGVNDNMIYSIEDSTADGLFTISENDGVITVLSAIDREVIGDTVTLTVKATESKTNTQGIHASTTASVLINILDMNDSEPKFYKCVGTGDELPCETASHFTGEVLEHSLGSIPINMTVKDLDKISQTDLILEGEYRDVFSVQPDFTMSDSIVQLLVKKPQTLDFEERQQMVLQVIAIDREKTSFRSTATVTITIKDTNDNSPTFQEDTYKLTVTEHSAVGTEVAKITAEDPDTMDQGNITYRLLPDSILPYFNVEPHTGTVYVNNATLLDRELRSLYLATLQARDTDGKPGTTVLEITLTDINDQRPVINRDSYLEFVEEGGKLEVIILATDADEPNTENSQIVFGIVPGNHSNNFTINPNTGVLTNNGELDLEALDPKLNGRIQLNVSATDKGTPSLSTFVTVIVNVEDVNDNTPQFKAPSYKFAVKEGVKGAFVGSVQAEDLDQTTDFNRISFSIISGSFGSFIIRTFAVENGYRGNITVDPDNELDYESARKKFKLQIEATDLEQKKVVMMVDVDVLDVNDERPEFLPAEPVIVKENTTISEPIRRFTAEDKDGNHSLVYELESVSCRCNNSFTPCSWFVLDPTGDVRVNLSHTVDYEQCDQAVVKAMVVDVYTEQGESSSATTGEMVINIEDINDNTPQFIFSDSVFVMVSESASKGTSIAGVTGIDLDSGIHKQIEFTVEAVHFQDMSDQISNKTKLFEAITTQQKDLYVGIIQSTEKLDISLKGKYLVTINAADTGGLSSSTVLDIFTVDESFRVELEFRFTADEIERKRAEIIRLLTIATRAYVEVIGIRSSSSATSRAAENSFMVTYFVYTNGTALSRGEVEKILTESKESVQLVDLGLQNILIGDIVNDQEIDPLKFALMGMVGGLVVVLAVLTTSLLCTRRSYNRKMKAAKAMNSASMVISDNQKSGPVVPGTNKYTMEGANPVLNLNIDSTLALDLDEDSSDVDKLSLNSLDYSDDMIAPEKGTKSNMYMIEEEEEDSGPPEYIEPLGAALAQRGQMRNPNTPHAGFTNPVFDTTDL
ncbi:cadherin-related family member 2 [Embiotoca jacksoni]|uniref:cadherin-related family member 2 n=1 Tax=Embiotoca jacksoni TaxID=100190 RepID=UPI0037039706